MTSSMTGRRRLAFLAAALILPALAAACAVPAPPAAPVAPDVAPDVGLGRAVAEQRCARCHAVGLADASASAQAPPLRDLYKRYPVTDLKRAFLRGIEVAHPQMPVLRLNEQEVDHLLAYLRSIDPCVQPSTDRAAMARCFEPL